MLFCIALLNMTYTYIRAVAGVYRAPLQVVPVGPVRNSLICMFVLFIYLCYLHNVTFFQVCRCPGTETE